MLFVIWIAPFFHAGWKWRSWEVFPRWWSFQHSAAGLFTRRTPVWWDHHLEALAAGPEMEDDRSEMVGSRKQKPPAPHDVSEVEKAGEGTRAPGPHSEREGYIELPERAFFPMGAFGYRTRLDRILNESNRSRVRDEVRERLARHVFDKEQEINKHGQAGAGAQRRQAEPILPHIQELRLVRSLWRVGSPEMARPAGAWDPPPVTELPGSQRQVLGAWRREEDGFLLALRAEPEKKLAPGGAPGWQPRAPARPGLGVPPGKDSGAPVGTVANERIRAALALQARLQAQRGQSGQESGRLRPPLQSPAPKPEMRETQLTQQKMDEGTAAAADPDGRATRPTLPPRVVRPPGTNQPLPRPPVPMRGAAGAPLPEKKEAGK